MEMPKFEIELNAVVDMAMKQVLDGTTANGITIREWIDKISSGEYVTRDQFCCAVNDFFNEFKENGADEETLAKCTFIGLAFSNLERRIFGSRDGENE